MQKYPKALIEEGAQKKEGWKQEKGETEKDSC